MAEKKKETHIALPIDLYERLKALAVEEDRTLRSVFRRMLDMYERKA